MKIMPEKPRRLFTLLAILGVVLLGEHWYRHWKPTHEISTAHYVIRSSAYPDQTKEIGEVVETLFATYEGLFKGHATLPPPKEKLKLKLFRDRSEFRRCNRGIGWAEAYYREPWCHAYYSAAETNPYHWMLHEAVHQLNREVAHLRLAKWLDEGLSEYFSTSVLKDGKLLLGTVDRDTYPVWWLDDLMLTGDFRSDLGRGQIIPLRAIITKRSGPSLSGHVNLYYIHWWSLTHFLFEAEGGRYREGCFRLIREGGSLAAFEKEIGPLESIEPQWYRHLQHLRDPDHVPPKPAHSGQP